MDGFTSLDFSTATLDTLIRLGKSAAEASLMRHSCFGANTVPSARALPKRIIGVSIGTRSSSERLALMRLLGLGLSDTLEPALLRSRVRYLAYSEPYRAVWLSPRGAADSIAFDVSLQHAPRRVAGLGLAYDNELGGRMWAGVVDRRLVGLALEGSSALFLGELRNELYLGFRRYFQVARQLMTPTLTVRLASESVRRFDSAGRELDALDTREILGFLGVERYVGRDWQVAIGVVAHDWDEGTRDLSTVGGSLQLFRWARGSGRVFQGSFVGTGAYRRATLEGVAVGKIGRMRLQPRIRAGWGERLPIQLELPLGGDNGFPGLHIGERRGDRELDVGLLLTCPLVGPVVARIDLAAGRSARSGPLLDTDGWLGGGRIGLGSETPLGPVRFEYGRNTSGRGSVFVRLGRWF